MQVEKSFGFSPGFQRFQAITVESSSNEAIHLSKFEAGSGSRADVLALLFRNG